MRPCKLIFVLIFSFMFSTLASADETLISIAIKKQQEKRNKGWSLSDWMATKQTMFEMDRWLALHTSSTPFEFRFRGGQDRLDQDKVVDGVVETTTKIRNWGKGTVNYSIFGVSLGYEFNETGNEQTVIKSSETMTADLSIRLFGKAMQDTNITGVYGFKSYTGDRTSRNQYWGGDGTIYLLPFVGVSGSYREYLNHCGAKDWCYHGHTVEYGGFLDISFFRPELTLFREKHYWKQDGTPSETKEIKGYKMTASIFF